MVTLDTKGLDAFLAPEELEAMQPEVERVHRSLREGSCPGGDFLGWLDLPENYDRAELAALQSAAERIRSQSDLLLVIGIGGSYLGARAGIECLCSSFYNLRAKQTPEILFVGNNLSPSYLRRVLERCEGKDVSLNVVSKSGTTTEPAVAFRVLKQMMEDRYGKEGARERIYCTTDQERGTMKALADREGYDTFVIPDDVGGRYSVLTPVGLLPMAVAGVDVQMVMEGAAQARETLSDPSLARNDCYRYAAIRYLLGRKGKQIELLSCFEPDFSLMGQWFAQLFGESEGKEHKGLYPTYAAFTTDLHSLGQYIQQGQRILMETVVDLGEPREDLVVPADPEGTDGLDFLDGETLSSINRRAMDGTILAHRAGGVPVLRLRLPTLNEREWGYLVYFFELACAVSGLLLGVNPFDQPGVEAYKKNMFALLGKPGYEALRAQLEQELRR